MHIEARENWQQTCGQLKQTLPTPHISNYLHHARNGATNEHDTYHEPPKELNAKVQRVIIRFHTAAASAKDVNDQKRSEKKTEQHSRPSNHYHPDGIACADQWICVNDVEAVLSERNQKQNICEYGNRGGNNRMKLDEDINNTEPLFAGHLLNAATTPHVIFGDLFHRRKVRDALQRSEDHNEHDVAEKH